MKNFSFLKYITIVVGFVFVLQSCDGNDSEFPVISSDGTSITWKNNTKISITPTQGKESFIWEKNLLTLNQYWKNETVELNANISTGLSLSNISKVDVYVTAEEKDGYNASAPFETNGKLVKTISSIPSSGDFTLELKADDLYGFFASKYTKDRATQKGHNGDLFELYWEVTLKNGDVLDSRNYFDSGYSYAFKGKYQELAPPVWQDTYTMEWLSGNNIFALFGLNIPVMDEFVITESSTPGTYNLTSILFNVNLGLTGTLKFDFNSGLTTVIDDAFGLVSWEFSNINGSSIDVEIKGLDNLIPIPGIVYKVRLTRKDGANWPANIHH